jgi:carboxylesterase type B
LEAGGASVHFLMMSDLAKGLFHQAIPMSGTSFIKTWPFADKKELTERLAKRLGWDGTGGERKILEILENAEAKKIVEVESDLLSEDEQLCEHIFFPFTPVIEPYVTDKTFLAEDPVLAGRKAWANDIDCLIGATSLEGTLLAFASGFSHFQNFIQNSDNFVTRELKLNPAKDQKKISEIGEKLKKLYFGSEQPSSATRHQYFLVLCI